MYHFTKFLRYPQRTFIKRKFSGGMSGLQRIQLEEKNGSINSYSKGEISKLMVPRKKFSMVSPLFSKKGFCIEIVPPGKRGSFAFPEATPCPITTFAGILILMSLIFSNYGQKHLKNLLPVPVGPIFTLILCMHFGQCPT